MIMDWLRRVFKVHSPNKEWQDIYKKKSVDHGRALDIPVNQKYPLNMTRAFLGLDPIIHVGKDEQVVKILEGKNLIIRYDCVLSEESLQIVKENIRNQIKENGFAVVDGRCKIIEFDNPKAIIEIK